VSWSWIRRHFWPKLPSHNREINLSSPNRINEHSSVAEIIDIHVQSYENVEYEPCKRNDNVRVISSLTQLAAAGGSCICYLIDPA